MITLPDSLARPRPRREDFQRAANYRLARLSEISPGLLRWTASRWSGGRRPSPPHAWRRGVILGPSHIGDVLYNTPSLPALRAGLPECRWTYVAAALGAEALRGNPFLEEIVAIGEPRDSAAWANRRREALEKRGAFDVALTYATAPWSDLLLAARLGIPNRIGYVHKGFSGLVTHPVTIRSPQPFPAYFRDLVLQVTGAAAETISSLRPLVYPSAADETAATEAASRLGLDLNEPVLACAVTSRQPSGVWPRDRFLESIRHVCARRPCPVLYFGAKSDAAELQELARQTGAGAHVLAGELGLPALAALLRRCRAALTTDSGARHLANAAGLPVVFVRNIGFRREEAGAYCGTDHDLAPDDLSLVPASSQAAAFDRIAPAEVGDRVLQFFA
jgi:ADP-heptose:LPS heptosyltransferase